VVGGSLCPDDQALGAVALELGLAELGLNPAGAIDRRVWPEDASSGAMPA